MLGSWEVWLGPVLGLVEIGLLFAAVYLTIAQFTRSRASSYIERFNSAEALDSRVAVDRWLQEHQTSKARLEALEADPRLRTHLRQFANLFQELGAAYQFRVAHRKTVRVLFDALVVMYWEALLFWIEDYRAQADPTLYARFEYLYEELREREKVDARRVDYVVAYGSLMDPTSAEAGIGRRVTNAELIPASVVGWGRRWSAEEQVVLQESGERVSAAFLDLVPTEDTDSTVVLLRVTPKELERLAYREKSYDLKDLRDDVLLTGDRHLGPAAAAWCFVSRAPGGSRGKEASGPILGDYLERVERAAAQIDPALAEEIRDGAVATGLDVAPGAYTFVDARQASLV